MMKILTTVSVEKIWSQIWSILELRNEDSKCYLTQICDRLWSSFDNRIINLFNLLQFPKFYHHKIHILEM